MRLTMKSSRFNYKTLFWTSAVIIGLLLVAAPVLANTQPGSNLLDFSRSTPAGSSLQTAQTLARGINISHLNPGQEYWYTFSRDAFNDPTFAWVSLALRAETEAQLESQQVNFDVFARPQSNGWFQSTETLGDAVGSGLASPLRGSQNTLETFWTGQVAEQQQYFVRVFNESPFGLDYTLEAKAEQPAVSGAIPAGLNEAKKNAIPQNIRQAAWTLTAQAVENMDAVAAADWMKKAQAVGWIVTEGTPAEAIPDPGQANPVLLWQLTAQAIEGQDAATAAEWLVQADLMGWLAIPYALPVNPNPDDFVEPTGGGNEGGSGNDSVEDAPAVPAPPDEVYAPVNIYPNKPLPFDLNHVNSGRLAPYGEHWYELTRADLDSDLIENMKMSMFFTPIQGYMSNRVNFEIFPAGQYHIWQRGDADYMENMGAGTWVSRDEDPNTGERLWNGTLIDGDRYLIKVKNGTPEEVDYYLFPDDVENAELGNPTLHTSTGSAVRIPYAASPPTRPTRPPLPGENPVEALPLELGHTAATLQAGEEVWYRFTFPGKGIDKAERDFELILTSTPLNDVVARHADFAIYPGAQLHLFTRGTLGDLSPMGTSADSPETLGDARERQVLWNGQFMEDHLYYIKIYNHDIGPLRFDLELKGGS